MQGFEDAQRMAKALSSSTLVPADYQGNVSNTLIALEMSQRTGSSPMAVMQNLHIIHGRPSWSSQFVIAALNSCGRFSPLRYRVEDLGDTDAKIDEWTGPKGQRTKSSRIIKVHDKSCVAWCYDKATGDVLEGPPVSIGMAVAEGWYTKDGSKWVTMPELMLRYRAAKFFGNLYAPDVLMGMHTADEVEDFDEPIRVQQAPRAANDNKPQASALDDLNSFAGTSTSTSTVIDAEVVVEPQKEKDTPRPRNRRAAKTETEATPEVIEPEVIEAEFEEQAQVTETVTVEPEPEQKAQTTQSSPVKDLF
jgi:hypothetical protein